MRGLASSIPPEVGFFVFRANQANDLVEGLGFSLKAGYIIGDNGKRVKFFCCGKDAVAVHLGRVMPGSLELICDDPLCFNQYTTSLVSE